MSDPAFTWAAALRLAGFHRVQAMLAWNLKSHDASAFARLPRAVRLELEAALLAARTRRLHYHAVVSSVFDRLNAQGNPVRSDERGRRDRDGVSRRRALAQ